MKIAQVAPLYESVPPKLYGGTERVVSYLTEELVRQGHDVTLFASGDSETSAQLIPSCERALRLDPSCKDKLAHHMVLLDQVFELAHEFDVIHFHIDYLHFPLSRRWEAPHVTTLHGRLDLPDLVPLYRQFSDVPVVSISDSQRKPLPWLNWQGTVYHGLPDELASFHPNADRYFMFVGRISPEKRIDRAIEIAKRCGCVLKVGAKVDQADRDYYETVRHLIDQPGVEFLGEINEEQKADLVGNAAALLFPIDWPEPFGLVMIESIALGTPVIAWKCGSVPEVVSDGVSGFICENIDQAVQAVARLPTLSRARCREEFERRFRAARMAEDYVRIYERLVGQSKQTKAADHGRSHSGPRPVLYSRDVIASR